MPSTRDRSLPFRWPVRYRVVWAALAALIVLCAVDAPRTLGSLSLGGVTALAGILLLGGSGQLLVIMIGGIDLSVQAAGLGEESARRNGIRVNRLKIACYIACAAIAALAGVFLAVQVGTGSNSVGASYALPAFAACFIGGARLTGGKGSFVGALLGAVFLTMLTNIGPLLNLPDATSQIAVGALTIVAVIAYAVTSRRGPAAG